MLSGTNYPRPVCVCTCKCAFPLQICRIVLAATSFHSLHCIGRHSCKWPQPVFNRNAICPELHAVLSPRCPFQHLNPRLPRSGWDSLWYAALFNRNGTRYSRDPTLQSLVFFLFVGLGGWGGYCSAHTYAAPIHQRTKRVLAAIAGRQVGGCSAVQRSTLVMQINVCFKFKRGWAFAHLHEFKFESFRLVSKFDSLSITQNRRTSFPTYHVAPASKMASPCILHRDDLSRDKIRCSIHPISSPV